MKQAHIFKIKNNDVTDWKNWCNELSSHRLTEVQESLIEEKVNHEVFISFSIAGQLYGLVYLDGECITPNQYRVLTHEHATKVAENLEHIGDGEVLLDVKPDTHYIQSQFTGSW